MPIDREKFLEISNKIADTAKEYDDDFVLEVFDQTFVTFLSVVKAKNEKASQDDIKSMVFNILFGEVPSQTFDPNYSFDSVDMNLIQSVKSAIENIDS
jgi:hypothetical protein